MRSASEVRGIIISFLLFQSLFVPDLVAQSQGKYLTAAEEAANWLTSIEHTEASCSGLSWPVSDVSTIRQTGLDEGAAGIGLFFLKLYQATHNSDYLEKARRASNFVFDQYSIGNTYGPDWLAGAASGGNFFLALFDETGDPVFLDRAQSTAGWLVQNAYSDGIGHYWRPSPTFPKVYTGIAHGAAGIGWFLLHLYEHSNDTLQLRYAEDSFEWLRQYAVQFDDSSIGWKRLTDDADVYHLWCGGSTGILFFLHELYSVTKKQIYLDYFSRTASGLLKYAVQNNGGYSWPYTTQGGSLPVIYCHGTASTAHALYLVHSLLRDDKYLTYARAGAEWVKNVKRVLNGAFYYWQHILDWDQFDTGLMTGTASVGHAFIQYFGFDRDTSYIDYARAAADYLLAVSDKPSLTQRRWISYTNPADPSYDQKVYYTGWYSGAAGIGIFLLELHEMLKLTGLGDGPDVSVPGSFLTLRNYPNPFNPGTFVVLDLPFGSPVTMDVFDASGRKVRVLVKNQFYSQGTYTIRWDARSEQGSPVPSGFYVVRVQTQQGACAHKITLLK